MPTRFEQRFKETPRTLYPPIPVEKLTPTETPTLDAPITPEAEAQTAPFEAEPMLVETKKQRRKRRAGVSLNNLPEEILQVRVKWFTLYTAALLALSIFGTAYIINSDWIQLQIQRYKSNLDLQRQQEVNKIARQTLSLSSVMTAWKMPDSAGGGSTAGSNIVTTSLTSERPYKEVWEFYAKKCGYTQPYQFDRFGTLSGAGTTEFSIDNTIVWPTPRKMTGQEFAAYQRKLDKNRAASADVKPTFLSQEALFSYRASTHSVVVRLLKRASDKATSIHITITK